MEVFSLFIVVSFVVNALAVQPGFQARITPKGLQFCKYYLKHVGPYWQWRHQTFYSGGAQGGHSSLMGGHH